MAIPETTTVKTTETTETTVEVIDKRPEEQGNLQQYPDFYQYLDRHDYVNSIDPNQTDSGL